MFWVKIIKKVIKILHSEISPNQIAAGAALGSIIGFTPLTSLHNFIVLLLIFLLKVNISSAFISIGIFGFIGLFTDPIAHKIGYTLLVEKTSLSSIWTSLYNMPVIPFTRFNNTVVLGSLIISLILFIPVFFVSKKFIVYYRSNLQSKVQNIKIVKWLKLSKVYGLYESYR